MVKKYGRRRGRKRSRSVAPRSLKKTIKKTLMSMSETKRHITQLGNEDNTLVNLPGFSYRLLQIPEGQSSFRRIGDEVAVTYMRIANSFINTTAQDVYIRWFVISDVQNNFDPVFTAMFEGVDTTNLTFENLVAANGSTSPIFQRMNKERVRIMKQGGFKLSGAGLDKSSKLLRVNVPWKKKLIFDGTTNNNIPRNSADDYVFWFFACSMDGENPPSGGVKISGTSEVYYKDI